MIWCSGSFTCWATLWKDLGYSFKNKEYYDLGTMIWVTLLKITIF